MFVSHLSKPSLRIRDRTRLPVRTTGCVIVEACKQPLLSADMPWQVSAKPGHAHQLGSMLVPAHDVYHFRRPLRQHRVRRAHRAAVSMAADAQHIMVNACTGKMGHATAEAVVRAGLSLVPYSFTGSSEAVAVGNVGVEGIPVELVGPEERQQAMEQAKREYPDMIIIDFTLPQAVNGNDQICCEVRLKPGSVLIQHFQGCHHQCRQCKVLLPEPGSFCHGNYWRG